MNWKIPLFKVYWGKDDVKAVEGVIKSGMNWATGSNIEGFEKEIAEYLGRKYALVFNSGTSALHSLMLAYGIGPDEEVIVPSFTFIATANAPLFVGAKPVFADIEEETLGLDPRDVEKKITKKTKMIMPIHYGGLVCQIEELSRLAKKNNLILVEDVAESLGSKVGNRMAGNFGHSAILSFCAPKVITSGEGGAVVTDSKKLYEKLKLIRSQGRAEVENYFSSAKYMDYVSLGYNFRMSNIVAALGRSQLKKIGKIIKMRQEKARYFTNKLSKVKELILPPIPSQNYSHVYQVYTIRVKDGRKIRNALKRYLNKEGVMAKVYFHPVHLTYFYKNKLRYRVCLPVTERVSEQALTLPLYPAISKKEMDYIIKKIKQFFGL
tara:strand:+ start:2801 stop:3937 length:1137 start_codon:yes stop_codon:yes gene_type:complete